jgi:hypothetical protein
MAGRWGTPILAAVVLVGVGLVVLSVQTRPNRHFPANYPENAPPGRAVPPTELAALGYLPDDTNFMIGFHVAEALHEPAAKEILESSSNALGKAIRDRLKEWTSLDLEDLDHAVVGLKLDDQSIPQVLLVVRTLRPYDIQRVVSTLKATRAAPSGGRTIYRFGLENPLRQTGYLWCPDERTMLIGLKAKDLEGVPPVPRPNSEHLLAPIRSFLGERVRSGAPLWAVGHVDDWEKTALHFFLALWLKDDWTMLSKAHTFGAWWQADGAITLNAAFECADEMAAEMLQKYLVTEENGEKKIFRSLGLPADAQGPINSWSRTLRADRTGAWVKIRAERGAGNTRAN